MSARHRWNDHGQSRAVRCVVLVERLHHPVSGVLFKAKTCMANQRVNDDDAQGKGVGQNELVPALRSVQEEVAEEEEKSNDKPQPGGEEFQPPRGIRSQWP